MLKKVIDPQISRVKFRSGGPFVTIDIYDEIDMDLAEYFVEQVNHGQNTGQEVIPVTINSPGGDVYALSVMLESIEGSTVPIATIVTGFAASAAVGLFAAGADNMRFIAPGGRLMIHNASMCGYGHMSLREVEIEGGELKLLNGQMFRQMGEHCKQDPEYYIKMIKAHGDHDLYMAARDALKHGLATHLGTPQFVTEVKVNTTMVYPDKKHQKKRMRTICEPAGKQSKKRKKSEDFSDHSENEDEDEDEDEEEKGKDTSKRVVKGKRKKKKHGHHN